MCRTLLEYQTFKNFCHKDVQLLRELEASSKLYIEQILQDEERSQRLLGIYY